MGEDSEDPAVVVRRGQQLKLGEDVRDVGLDRLRGEEERVADRLVRATLRYQRENLTLALGQVVERDPGPAPADELGDHLRIDHGPALGNPSDRVGKVVEVVDAVLQQVADTAGAVGNQPQGEGRFHVLRQDEDADGGAVLGANRLGRSETLVGVGRWHSDVDDRDVGMMIPDRREELSRVAGLCDDLEAGFHEQPGDSFPEKDGIVRENDP